MGHTERPVVIVGNWKMYKTIEESLQFLNDLAPQVKDCTGKIYLAIPFTAIKPVAEQARNTTIVIGAQNMNDASEGAFTGEIASRMLKDAGAKFVILGHSERRQVFKESNAFINKKIKRAIVEQLPAILCIGETALEYGEGKTQEVIKNQLNECLANIEEEQLSTLMIAYEPVWAIGTDQTATPEIAQNVHFFCRQFIAEKWGEAAAERIPILYGGSVKAGNAKDLMDQADIDGLLVGGASLSVDSFNAIVHYQNS